MSALKRVPSFIHQQTRLSVNKQAVVSSNSSAINSGKHKINHTPVFVFFFSPCGLPFSNVTKLFSLLYNILQHPGDIVSDIFAIGKGCYRTPYLLQESFLMLYMGLLLETLCY